MRVAYILRVSGKHNKNTEQIMRESIIKYLLNFTGLSLMIFYANLGYGIIARIPECEYVKSTIWSVVGELSKIYLVYLIIITAINILFLTKQIVSLTKLKIM